MREAVSFKLLSEICLYSLNDLVGAVAVLLFISGVTACASAHDLPLPVSVVAEAYRRRGGKVL